jgi:peptide/nickel transport system permease protein
MNRQFFGFVAKRLGQGAIVLVGISIVTFLLLYVIPSDPASLIAGRAANPDTIARINAQLGLDKPVWLRYAIYMGHLLHGNLGTSYVERTQVAHELLSRLPATLELVSGAIFWEVAIGVSLGVVGGVWRGRLADRLAMGFAYVTVAAPQFVTGLLLLYVFGFQLGWLPLGGYGGLSYLLLPSLTLGLLNAAWHTRVVRSEVVREQGEPYVEAALARGVSRRTVILRHVVPGAILPVPTLVGLDFGYLMGGAVIIDQVFGWPGVGQYMWQGIQNTDVPVIMGVTLFAAVFVVIANIIADIISYFIDPRIRVT